MGGKGSGGPRPGAGRKRQSQAKGALTGSRRTRARASKTAAPITSNPTKGNQNASRNQNTPGVVTQPTVAIDIEIPQPPGNLTLDELAEWNDLAPRAAKEGTLNESTAYALRDLCQLRVLKDRLLRRVGDDGDVVFGAQGQHAAHPLLSRITTLSQRIEAAMVRFKLSPMGKELEGSKEPPADPFAEFDTPAVAGDGQTIN